MGDHFDWGKPADRAKATEEGTAILSWLAAHPPDQVQIVFGNHDMVRVGELSGFNQRLLVTKLLKKRRARLAVAVAPDLLLVHAGLTVENLEFLEVTGRDAFAIAAALNRYMDSRVAKWDPQLPLDLSPLHEGGSARDGEAKGILFHRPANPLINKVDRASRRFDPRSLLRKVCQAIGHINDKKCRELLGDWADSPTAVFGKIRGMRVGDARVHYQVGCSDDDALIFLDGAMNQVAPAAYELFDLELRQPFVLR